MIVTIITIICITCSHLHAAEVNKINPALRASLVWKALSQDARPSTDITKTATLYKTIAAENCRVTPISSTPGQILNVSYSVTGNVAFVMTKKTVSAPQVMLFGTLFTQDCDDPYIPRHRLKFQDTAYHCSALSGDGKVIAVYTGDTILYVEPPYTTIPLLATVKPIAGQDSLSTINLNDQGTVCILKQSKTANIWYRNGNKPWTALCTLYAVHKIGMDGPGNRIVALSHLKGEEASILQWKRQNNNDDYEHTQLSDFIKKDIIIDCDISPNKGYVVVLTIAPQQNRTYTLKLVSPEGTVKDMQLDGKDQNISSVYFPHSDSHVVLVTQYHNVPMPTIYTLFPQLTKCSILPTKNTIMHNAEDDLFTDYRSKTHWWYPTLYPNDDNTKPITIILPHPFAPALCCYPKFLAYGSFVCIATNTTNDSYLLICNPCGEHFQHVSEMIQTPNPEFVNNLYDKNTIDNTEIAQLYNSKFHDDTADFLIDSLRTEPQNTSNQATIPRTPSAATTPLPSNTQQFPTKGSASPRTIGNIPARIGAALVGYFSNNRKEKEQQQANHPQPMPLMPTATVQPQPGEQRRPETRPLLQYVYLWTVTKPVQFIYNTWRSIVSLFGF
jgi:hypothetical protein